MKGDNEPSLLGPLCPTFQSSLLFLLQHERLTFVLHQWRMHHVCRPYARVLTPLCLSNRELCGGWGWKKFDPMNNITVKKFTSIWKGKFWKVFFYYFFLSRFFNCLNRISTNINSISGDENKKFHTGNHLYSYKLLRHTASSYGIDQNLNLPNNLPTISLQKYSPTFH